MRAHLRRAGRVMRKSVSAKRTLEVIEKMASRVCLLQKARPIVFGINTLFCDMLLTLCRLVSRLRAQRELFWQQTAALP
jgi:hypothetical protein